MIETQIKDQEFLFSARLEIDHLNDEYGLGLPDSDNFETLAGFIIDVHESIPSMNEVIEFEQFVFTIKKVFDNKIDLVHLRVKEEE